MWAMSDFLGFFVAGQRPKTNDQFPLASRRESADMGHGEAQEFVRIDWSVIDADFVVQMWASAATAQPDISDSVAPANILPGDNRIVSQMPVAGGNSVSVVE